LSSPSMGHPARFGTATIDSDMSAMDFLHHRQHHAH
jgi:hypothetical protein